MARILGLDLGSHTVRAVLFESTLRGYATRAYGEARRGEGDRAESLRAALTELFGKAPLAADQVIVAVPGTSLATHALSLPFTDAKRLEATIPFEIESQLPFDLADAVFDYQVAGQQEKKSDLLLGVLRKDELRPLLDLLKGLKVDPRIVTHPALTYQNLLAQAAGCFPSADPSLPVAIVDLGHERTNLAIGRLGGTLELARTFAAGGKDLTRALAAEFQVSPAEAAQWKEAQGTLAPAAGSPDAERASQALVRGLQSILRELRPSLKAYTARTRASVARIYLCGGTAKLPGLAEQLTRDLGIPCELLKLPEEALGTIPNEEQPAAAQAYALALRGQASGAKVPRFNLRRGEFAFKGDFDFLRERAGTIAAFAATLLLLLISSGIVRNTVLARRERQLDDLLCQTTQRVVGKCERDFRVARNLLEGKESPAAAIPKGSAVALLAELSQRLPSDVPIALVDRMEIDLERIAVKIETDSSKQVDKIISALKANPCFKEVKGGRVERSKDGSKVTFRLDVQVECPTQAPGQG